MRHSLKRWCYLTHRWLGIGLCLLFAMWFASGVVMMYSGYPKLTVQERLQHLPALSESSTPEALLSPQQLLERAGWQQPVQALRLARLRGGQPVYLLMPVADAATATGSKRRQPSAVVLDARSAALLPPADADVALASAAAWAGDAQGLTYLGQLQEDAHTHSRALDVHRPLHRVALADGSWLYLSSRTGEVVRDASRSERGWNYAGAWLHWLYPLRGGVLDRYWADIVNWLSILGIAGAITGTVVGILRWRFRAPYRSGRRTPYPGRLMRWHHVCGLLFAAITLSWIFSGLMSMNPWRIFSSATAPVQAGALHGAALTGLEGGTSPQQLLQAAGPGTRELRWTMVLGQPVVMAYGSLPTPQLLDAQARPYAVDAAALRSAIPSLLPAPLERIETLQTYDFYYYARTAHSMTGGGDKPLPVWRAVFGDAQHTWVHIDPHTGAVLDSLDRHRRTSRWLFALLHSWDWLPLLERRPLWDALLITLSLGGLLLSLSGVVMGWRRLRTSLHIPRPLRPPRSRR
ncbi:PepSY domain-containing protein [Comamonas sp. GB3 AK4-5]|uniref:PepSY domain-containing protein n=1 Tax=Comamonas sp. GB3 AK4-5 TaxID=3231487 RepID=UPI00351E8CC1